MSRAFAADHEVAPDRQHDEIRSRSYRTVCSNTQPEEACNDDDYNHDADDVEDVHCGTPIEA